MTTLLNYTIHQAVAHDGLPRVANYDDGSQQVLYLDGAIVRSMLATDWLTTRGPLPTDPTSDQVAAAIAAREAARQQALTDAAALRQQILTIAQGAVGTRIDLLTAAQTRALFAASLWRDGAVKADLTIRPLSEWVKS